MAAAVTATSRRTPGGRAVGSVLIVVGAIAVTAALSLAAIEGRTTDRATAYIMVVLMVVLSTFGATAATTGAIGASSVQSALPVTAFSLLPVSAVAAGYADLFHELIPTAPHEGANISAVISENVLFPNDQPEAAISFVFLLVGGLWLSAYLIPRLSLSELVPREKRSEARQFVRRVATGLSRFSLLTLLGSVGLGVFMRLSHGDRIQRVTETLPMSTIEAFLHSITTVVGLRIIILLGIGVVLLVYFLSKLRRLRSIEEYVIIQWLPAGAGGALVAVFVIIAYPYAFEQWIRPVARGTSEQGPGPLLWVAEAGVELSQLAPPNGIALAAIAMIGIIGGLFGILAIVWLLESVQLLPDRGPSGGLAAAALIGGTIAAAVAEASVVVVSGAVAFAILSWDAATYGVSATEELGPDTDIRRPALAHALGSAVVGGIGIALALGANQIAQTIAEETGIIIVGGLVVGFLALAITLTASSSA
ncbi:DUF7519 family protein [Natronomonas pharaonis]|nr:hypothetical protein [Natronomonas pharaonis]